MLSECLDVEEDGVDFVILEDTEIGRHPDAGFFRLVSFRDPSARIEDRFPEVGLVHGFDEGSVGKSAP
jgi:hypothetical protein